MLFSVSRTFDDDKKHIQRISNNSLPDSIFDDTKMHIEDIIKYSTKRAFQQSEFYHDLPPRLKKKLIFNVLNKQINTMRFFFNDYIR